MATAETKWIYLESDVLFKLVNEFKLNKFPSSFISLDLNGVIDIKIYSPNFDLHKDFYSLHKAAISHSNNDKIEINLFIVSENRNYFLSRIGVNYKKIQEENIGIFNNSINTCIFLGKDNYGLIKSTAIGLATYQLRKDSFFPVHGSFLEINGKGIVFFGGQKVGKSTVLMNFINTKVFTDLKFATDDWLVSYKSNGKLFGRAVEHNLSFIEEDLSQFSIEKRNLIHIRTSPNKVYVYKKNLFHDDQLFDSKEINIVVCLMRNLASETPISTSSELISAEILDSSYHSPYFSKDKDYALKFWSENLKYNPNLFLMNALYGELTVSEKISFLLEKCT